MSTDSGNATIIEARGATAPRASAWLSRRLRRRRRAGFTMLEMLIVVALVGIVATLALPSYRHATDKAREAVLREDLWVFRDVIDQFFTDKGRYPSSLDELVTAGYIRRVPVDPITGSAETWEVTYEPLSEDLADGPEFEEPGITDVRSGARGRATDGSYYNEW